VGKCVILEAVMKNLVVVESPTKTRTLKKFLGKDFEIKASLGHIKDLPKSKLGVDVEHDFKPQYQIAPGKKKVVKELREAAEKADQVYLATDPDREGEAIASHVNEEIAKSKKQKAKRVVFHEITKDAVAEAFKHPRDIDANLVDAQKARRVLDRLVGYKLSPLLWKKIRYGLSAGRVQSVAVRLIVEREREREKFKPQEYWRINAKLRAQSANKDQSFYAELKSKGEKSFFVSEKIQLFAGPYRIERTTITSKAEAEALVKKLSKKDFVVEAVDKRKVRRPPSPPFTTATLQRAAAGLFGFSSKRTMRAAQNLYEQGLITYHRTDSVSLSQKFLADARAFLKKKFPPAYLPEKPRQYKTKSRTAQEAHEAIRPTDVGLQVQSSKFKVQNLGRDEAKLYKLIWQRAVSSQMADAVFDATRVTIRAGDYLFEARGSVLKFDGWKKIAGRAHPTPTEETLPPLERGEVLHLISLLPSEHFTSPPPRYTEATLIKDLEKFEIGRPSTYAPIISTIQERGYINRENGYLVPADIGIVVNDLLVKHFPEIVDLKFTARMEEDLDEIARGKKEWVPVIREFYEPFEEELRIKNKELRKGDFTTLQRTEEKCPECGKPLVVKLGKYGKFLSCSGFPECRYSRPYEPPATSSQQPAIDQSQLEGRCPECGGELVLKDGRFGKFIACANYPKCKFTKQYLQKIGMKCPECGQGEVIIKRSKRGKVFYGCSRYPECKWASWKDPRRLADKKANKA